LEASLAFCATDEERLAVLSPLSNALQLAGEWDRTKEVLQMCIRLNSTRDGADPHCKFEVMLFQARARSSLDFVDLLTELMPCVTSKTATAQHRVSAAVVALKIASDVGPALLLDTIYAEVAPFLKLDEVDPVSRLEVEIIYQTMRSAQPIAFDLLTSFVKTARALHGEIAYSHALLAAASSSRIKGQFEQAAKFIGQAFEHAVSHKLGARVAVIQLGTVRLQVAACNWRLARSALAAQQSYPIAEQDMNTRAEWEFFEARVSLEEGDLMGAVRGLPKLETVPHGASAGRRAACLALALRIRLSIDDQLVAIRKLVDDLEAAHMATRDIGNQDFEAHALFLGLTAIGQNARAWELLLGYLENDRTLPRALSVEIRNLLQQRFGSSPSSGALKRSRNLNELRA
jgi:hypothetical protein